MLSAAVNELVFAALHESAYGPFSPFQGWAEHGSSAQVLQTSIFSAALKFSA
jgi:hypothetical protein